MAASCTLGDAGVVLKSCVKNMCFGEYWKFVLLVERAQNLFRSGFYLILALPLADNKMG